MKVEELLEQITNEIVIEIMEEHGAPVLNKGVTSDGTPFLVFRTICHHSVGGSPKLYYYCNSKTFYCYTSCGYMSLFDLIRKIEGFPDDSSGFAQAFTYLANKAGVLINNGRYTIQDGPLVKEFELDSYINSNKRLEKHNMSTHNSFAQKEITEFYDSNILNYFDPNTFYKGWIDEGITIETMEQFNIRWYEFQNHIIIPHYNINGDLVGIRRRSLNPEDSKSKYMPEYIEGKSYEHPLGLNLYGLYQNKEAIRKQQRALIVEGEKSVLLSNSYYGKDSVAVATCGFNISNWQIKALLNLGVNEIFIGFDKDYDITKAEEYKQNKIEYEGFIRYQDRLNSLCEKYTTDFKVRLIQDKWGLLDIKDSPCDKGKDTLNTLMRKAKIIDTLL